MADGLEFGRFRVDRAGVVAVLKSPGVVSLVTGHAERIRDAANATAREHLTAEDLHVIQSYDEGVMTDPYEAEVKSGRFDTLGVVRSANAWGAYDSNQHHTLDSLNH